MYTILTKASINQIPYFVCKYMEPVRNLPQSTCPNRLNIKLINAQVGCVTIVDSYSLYACTNVAGVRYISEKVCYDQVLFTAVTQLQQFEEKSPKIFPASRFHKIAYYV